jgi:poly(3-hydroxybutyrate) depolymerase
MSARGRERMRAAACFAVMFVGLTAWCFAEEVEFTFKSSFDGSEQRAVAYVPDSAKAKTRAPLVVIAHFMGGNRLTARNGGYYPECDARGYLLVCPELHGHRTSGPTSLASLEAQHDLIDAVAYMKDHYKVDTSRVYIVGRSMGGMLGALMAAKYPDLFAAVVAGQGIYDLARWMVTTTPSLRASAEKECLVLTDSTRFDYQRRSAVTFAGNLQYVPLILWGGTNDTWVPPEQAELLQKAAGKYTRLVPEIHWLYGAAHCPVNYDPKWEFDQLTYYQNVCENGFDTPTRFFPALDIVTDEAKGFYWMQITPSRPDRLARVQANIDHGVVDIRAENAREIIIRLDQVSRTISCATYRISTNTPLRLTFVRGGETVFTAEGKKGNLPEKLFARPK